MSDLVEHYTQSVPGMSDQEKADTLKVIEEHIKSTMQVAQHAGKQVAEALSDSYREAWSIQLEKYRHDLAELEAVKQLLTN